MPTDGSNNWHSCLQEHEMKKPETTALPSTQFALVAVG
jgi:hypothetical protein